MAKIIAVYAENFLDKKGEEKAECATFNDLNQVNDELQFYIVQVCALGLMGYYADGKTLKASFLPNDTITLAEVATVLSRLL
jgi:hypothetical protein